MIPPSIRVITRWASHLSAAGVVSLAWLQAIPTAAAQAVVSPGEAIRHVGEHATVCGVVASAAYAEGSRGSPTFLNLDRPYPLQVFTGVVWGEDRPKFSQPPETLEGDGVCITGLIETYKGRAEIIVTDPAQIERR